MAANPFGKKLFDFVSGSGIVIHSQCVPTFFGASCRPDILDFDLSKDIDLNVLSSYTRADLSPNDNPVLVEIEGRGLYLS